jgi:hypothetical protein
VPYFVSLEKTLKSAIYILQVTSLLRADESTDEITFHLRACDKQEPQSRDCGFFAVATAVSCWLLQDPTGHVFNQPSLRPHHQMILDSRNVDVFPSCRVNVPNETITTIKKEKMHCKCQNGAKSKSKFMIQCSSCLNWYHRPCIGLSKKATPVKRESQIWLGPCCGSHHQDSVEIEEQ